MASRVALLLAPVLPLPALALGPAVLDSPDLRQLSAGPMVYGGGDGVTCTPVPGVGLRCSDGRVSTTVRASTVPCETAAGTWTHVAAGTACVSVRGLESWGANTTLLSFGDKLDNAAWELLAGAVVTAAPGGGWRITRPFGGGGTSTSFSQNAGAPPGTNQTRTSACLLRAAGSPDVRLGVEAASANRGIITGDLTADWKAISYTGTVNAGAQPALRLFPNPTASPTATDSVDALACWHVAASTPGRPCWFANGAAGTCAADVHTISTSGWPTTVGEISITYRLAESCPAGTSCFIFDGRMSGGDLTNPPQLFINSTGNVSIAGWGLGTINVGGAQPPAGSYETITVRRTADGTGVVLRNGVVVRSDPRPAFTWNTAARLGVRYADQANFTSLNGTISRLSWSAK